MMTATEGLEGLKAFFNEHDWCQGDFSKDDPATGRRSWCILGGLAVSGVDYSTTLDALWRASSRGEYASLASWNDAEGRTKDDILALIDRAIELEKVPA